jgi:hypothetical protein
MDYELKAFRTFSGVVVHAKKFFKLERLACCIYSGPLAPVASATMIEKYSHRYTSRMVNSIQQLFLTPVTRKIWGICTVDNFLSLLQL